MSTALSTTELPLFVMAVTCDDTSRVLVPNDRRRQPLGGRRHQPS